MRPGDRVALNDEWLHHPFRTHYRHSEKRFEPDKGDIGTVVARHRDGDVRVVWDADPKQQKTRWADFWLRKVADD